MDYSKFYTPPEIATALVKELSIPEPQKIVDICCGSCNLLFAAKKRWPEAKLYGVDVAEQCFTEDVMFDKGDGRQFAIKHPREFSLVVANPPFDYVKRKKEFPTLFTQEFEDISTSRLEVEMLIANLKLLQPAGVLLIIVPSSLVEAKTHQKVRKVIAENYFVESIIKLDESTFGASKINSYALIIHNELPDNQTTKFGYSVENRILYTSSLGCDNLKDGNWIVGNVHNGSLAMEIKRGNISSASFLTRGQPILHTAKCSSCWKPSKRYISTKVVPTVFAETGDIIVSRIGKSAGQWCVYNGPKIPISDCLYRIKDPDGSITDLISGKTFDKALKGVATRYITIDDLCIWLSSQ